MSDKEQILTVMRAPHRFTLRHENGHDYRLENLLRFKADGSWRDGVLYKRVGEKGYYGRELGDFTNFTISERKPEAASKSERTFIHKPIKTVKQNHIKGFSLLFISLLINFSIGMTALNSPNESVLINFISGSGINLLLCVTMIMLIPLLIGFLGAAHLVAKESWKFTYYHKTLCWVSAHDLTDHKWYLEEFKSVRGDIAMSLIEMFRFRRSVIKKLEANQRKEQLGWILD